MISLVIRGLCLIINAIIFLTKKISCDITVQTNKKTYIVNKSLKKRLTFKIKTNLSWQKKVELPRIR